MSPIPRTSMVWVQSDAQGRYVLDVPVPDRVCGSLEVVFSYAFGDAFPRVEDVSVSYPLHGCGTHEVDHDFRPRIPIAVLDIAPAVATLAVGDSVGFAATARDSTGAILRRDSRWSSSDGGVVAVDFLTGKAAAVAPGTATITAVSEGVRGSATVTVVPR